MPAIYVDISNTYISKATTGIQRVVRELSRRLALSVPEMVFIHFNREKGCYYKLQSPAISLDCACVKSRIKTGTADDDFFFTDLNRGDIFIELDAAWGDPLDRYSLLAMLKTKGVIIICMHYDAVPVLFPDFSHPSTVYRYTGYIAAHLDFADYFICISDTVKTDLQKLSLKITNRKVTAFTIPLGADFDKPDITDQKKQNDSKIIEAIISKKFLLAVGTLEPRKNHAMLLAAYDLLDEKHQLNLVIIGKQGWNIDELARDIKNRSDFGKNLFWLENADDTQLLRFYENAFICVNVAHYEGYGLPVIEALDHNCVTICSRGGALEEIAPGACRVLAENTASCLAADITDLYDNQQSYLYYKKQAENFNPPTWDDSCRQFINILDYIKYGENFNWGFMPQQAVYISIDTDHFSLSIRSVMQNMNFIKKFVLLTAEKYKNDMITVLEKTGKKYIIITDEEIYHKFQVSSDEFNDHVRRNTFLRQALFKDDAIDANFISFDDDYLVQGEVGPDFFMDDKRHFGFYFIEDADQWLGTPTLPTSYDAGIFHTGAALKACGYDRRIFSSHMPQIINKKMAGIVYNRMVNMQAKAMCEWTLYFNIFSYLYPHHCSVKNYATLSWPCDPTDWIPSKLPDNCLFENYYKWNYQKGGCFYGMQIIGDFSEKTAVWKKTFNGQYRQRELNRQQFGKDNPDIILFDNRMEFDSIAWDVFDNELLRIRIKNKTDSLSDTRLNVCLLGGKNLLSKEEFDPLTAGWVPVRAANIADKILLELSFYDIKNQKLIDRKIIKINFVTKIDKKRIYGTSRFMMAKSELRKQELMDQLSLIDTDDLFIKKAYELILNREAGHEELEVMLVQLKLGVSKKNIIVNMLLSPEKAKNNKGGVQLTWLEKKTTFLWKKWHYFCSRLKVIRNFFGATLVQNKSFDQLIFGLQQSLSSHNRQFTDIRNRLQVLPEYVEQIKSKILFFQHQEAQAQQRRLDQFFFDIRQELRLTRDNNMLEKMESLSEHAIDRYYLALEESYRGSRDEILIRYEPYLNFVRPLFKQIKEIRAVDLGCGRGEWLQIISQFCANAKGIDFNSSMVAECRSHGLHAEQGDLLEWLQQQPDLSLDLITAFHIIEHLSFQQFNMLIAQIYRVLSCNGIVMIETPNPENVNVATHMFYRDPTHKKPIPKELTEHLLNYNGFTDITVHPMHPFPKKMHLPEENELSRRFNLLVYGAQDYLITGRKQLTVNC